MFAYQTRNRQEQARERLTVALKFQIKSLHVQPLAASRF